MCYPGRMQSPPVPVTVRSDYRPDIDGLRAIAVLSVLAFHYGAPLPAEWSLQGGFTGVDVFFVISGFLITSKISEDISAGTFSVLGFYDRRMRRILPALLTMLAVTLLAAKFLLMPGDYMALAKSTAAAAFGISNFFFRGHTNYFDQASGLMPLLHTWSLAVEEQFYLVWPLLLFVIAAGRKRNDVAAIIGVITIVGFGVSIVWFEADAKAAFYMALPRAWELAIGAVLVFLPPLPRALGEVATALGLVLIAAGFVVITETAFPGPAALLPCIGSALVIWPRRQQTHAASWLGRLWPIGMISYSLYLWHWPVWVLFRIYINNGTPRIREALALAAVSIALAILSYRFIEQPFRRRRWQPAQTVWAGLAACTLLFCAAAYVDSADGLPERIPEQLQAMRSMDVMWDWPCQTMDLSSDIKATCVFGADWNITANKAVLWGDSIAQTIGPLLADSAGKAGVSVALYYRCAPILDGVKIITSSEETPDYNGWCGKSRNALLSLLEKSPDIKTVILSASWQPALSLLKSNDKSAVFDLGIEEIVQRLHILGRHVVIVATPPQWTHDPLPCEMLLAGLPRRQCSDDLKDISRSYYDVSYGSTLDSFRKAAALIPDVDVIVPGDGMCGDLHCLSYLDGEGIYRDAAHLRRNLSDATKQDLAKIMGLDQIFR